MKDQLFIPKEIKVGYNQRSDTYTEKLGFIIYKDAKGVWKQEKAWERWRDEREGVNEYENLPTEGFVLNKDVGGVKCGWSYHSRTEKIRVYDPRGFEFEITIPNLLFILAESPSIPGKGLTGEFVYSWDNGGGVILMPCCSNEYKQSLTFTSIQGNKLDKGELIEGAVYQNKQQENLIYLGRHTTYCNDINYTHYNTFSPKPQYIFYDENADRFVTYTTLEQISNLVDAAPVANYAYLVDKLQNNKFVGKVESFDSRGTSIKWKSQYYGENFGDESGQHSHYASWDGTKYPVNEKLSGYDIPPYYLETSPGVFRQCTLNKHKVDVTPDSEKTDHHYYLKWKVDHFFITSSKSIQLVDGELVVKNSTNPFKGKKFTKKEINEMDWRSLQVKDKFGKHHKIA